MKHYLAIDIGASSGRHIVGWLEDGVLKTEEVFRFPNGVQQRDDHLVWDMEALFSYVKEGIGAAFAKYPQIESLSVDTWGCDYVLLDGDRELWPCYAYRDSRTEAIHEEVHAAISFSECYRRTGSQFQLFNTIYQLAEDLQTGRLENATDFLMVPEYLMYKLTGVKKKEFTNATTTGLINADTLEFDREILARLGLPQRLFPKLSQPGEVLGNLLPDVASEVGGTCRVVLCATHDTASAVEGIPMEGNAPYISSGTWSLLGVKTPKPITDEASEDANWSNEGGVGYNRYQKNIMGMWLVNRLRAELCPDMPWNEIIHAAEQSSFDGQVNANDERFLSPVSMKRAFDLALRRIMPRSEETDLRITNMTEEQIQAWNDRVPPLSVGDYFRCAYRSLAISYKNALDELERNTGRTSDQLYIVGGGAKNRFLNGLTAEYTKKQVIALPIEATAIGNLRIQINME